MNVDTLVKTTLEKLGCPVERLKYDGKAKTFITYQIVVGQDTHFSDDESGAEEFTYRADIYSRVDYIALMRNFRVDLIDNGGNNAANGSIQPLVRDLRSCN